MSATVPFLIVNGVTSFTSIRVVNLEVLGTAVVRESQTVLGRITIVPPAGADALVVRDSTSTVDRIKLTEAGEMKAVNVTLSPLTSDPALAPGKIWFRGDVNKLKFSSDGSTTTNILKEDDPLNIAQISGTNLTPRDWSNDFAKLQNLNVTAAGNLRVALLETTIKQPIDVQDHWSESVVLLDSAARTASGSSADIDVGRFICGEICVDVTAVSGTSPVLNVYVEGKDRYTGKYKVLFAHENITSVQTIWDTITTLPFSLLRVRWTISGTSPSFTFSVSGEFKS
ncbi:MAG: hypothetical protein QXI01_06810 [Nitrososphaerota archaeon]